jgi:VanZ family protein
VIWRIALGVYWIVLAAATHYPRVALPNEIPHSDKLVHFAAFGTLAALFYFASRRTLLTALVVIPYSIVDEYTQQFVGRYTDFADAIANISGIAIALAAIEITKRIRRTRTVSSKTR